MTLAITIFLALFFIIYIYPSSSAIRSLKHSLLFPLLFVAFIVCLIVFSGQSFKAAQYGFYLWINVVFPSLFPFFVSAELLKRTGFIKAAGIFFEPIMRPIFNIPGAGCFAFAMGLFSGYPVGAKIATDLFEAKLCSKEEAQRLIAFSNNSSPLFITGAAASGIFNRPDLGILLLLAHYFGCITVGVLLGIYSRLAKKFRDSYEFKSRHNAKAAPTHFSVFQRVKNEIKNSSSLGFNNIGSCLGESITNSVNTLLMICGFIVLFSVLISILMKLQVIDLISFVFRPIFYSINFAYSLSTPIAAGLFEITNGINLIKLSFAPLSQKIIIASFILGWGGLSVHAQVASIISKAGISIKPYLIGKFGQGLFAAVYTSILLNITGYTKNQELPVFWNFDFQLKLPWTEYLIKSTETCGLIILIFIASAYAIRCRGVRGNGSR